MAAVRTSSTSTVARPREGIRGNDIVIGMAPPTMFLIDGSSQMYRAYHAFRGRGLSNQEGHTTHAVYVFVTMLRKVIADHHPTYMASSFDFAWSTFRSAIVTDYT